MAEGNVASWLLAGVLGALLGACFYASLWWTVRLALLSPRPGVWFVGSLALRSSVAFGLGKTSVAGIYAIAGAQWQRMLLCLLGFMLARPLVARLTRPATARAT